MRVGSLFVVTCLVLAGCGGVAPPGGGDDGATTPTVTPAPVPAASGDTNLAPGLSRTGVAGPVALLSAHTDRLDGTGFHTTRTTVRRFANGTVVSRVRTAAWFGRDGTYYVTRAIEGVARDRLGFRSRVEQYATPERGFRRRAVGDRNATYTPTGPASPFPPEPTALLADPTAGREVLLAVAAVNASVVERRTVGERSRYRLAGRGIRSREALRSFVGRSNVSTLSNATLSAVVTDRGLVRSYRVSYTERRDGVPIRVVRTGRFEGVGNTTVPRPDWYDTAVERTTNRSAAPR